MRDDPNYEANKDEVWANLREAATRVKVVFTEVAGTSKPKPQYLPAGSWGSG